MSGLPPPGMCHVRTMRRVANETTEIEPCAAIRDVEVARVAARIEAVRAAARSA